MKRWLARVLLPPALLAVLLGGCGKKPGDPVAPPRADSERFPKTYPEPERLP